MMIPYTNLPGGISFIVNGRPRNIAKDNVNYDEIKSAVIAGDVEALEKLCDISSFIAKITNGLVQISDEEVRYNNKRVPDYLAQRILEHSKNNEPIDPLCRFTEKLMQNPDEAGGIVDDLYGWLEAGKMPLYPDGDFVAYKVVKKDFTPIHNGPYGKDQSVGKVVEMPRELCDHSRHNTCSSGLHFCSYEYLPHFNGFSEHNVIIVLKINPADVTAIPTDYNNTKGRTCRFEVVGTVPIDEIKNTFNVGVYNHLEETVSEEVEEELDSWGDDLYEDSWSWEDDAGDEMDDIPFHKVTFERDGTTFTDAEIKGAVERHGGVTAASRHLGVPRSTLSRWIKKIS